MDLNNFELADQLIASFSIDFEHKTMKIVAEGAYSISESKQVGRTHIEISEWNSLQLNKFISVPEQDSGWVRLNATNYEKFELIQICKMNAENIRLEGWSKDSGQWLAYAIYNFRVTVEVSDK